MAGVGRGIVIPLSLNPRSWLQGMRVVEQSLDDMSQELLDVEDAGDRIERSLQANFRDISRAGSDVDIDIDRGGSLRGRAGLVGAEIGDEFAENFGEAIRGGNPAEALLETFTSLGPALGALGLGAALVAGLVNSARVEAQRRADAIRSAVSGLLQGAVEDASETGRQIADALFGPTLGLGEKLANIQEFYGADTLLQALSMAKEDADLVGVEMLDIVDAIGGAGAEQRKANAKLQEAEATLNRMGDAANRPPGAIGRAASNAADLTTQTERARDRMATLSGAADNNADALRDAAGYARDLDNELSNAARHAADVQWEINKIPKSVTVNVINKVTRIPKP